MADFDSATDLLCERVVQASPDAIWRSWSELELFAKWFAPDPMVVAEASVTLRAGGKLDVTMQSPSGAARRFEGCFLAVEPGWRVIYTDALAEHWRPTATPSVTMIFSTTLEDAGTNCSIVAKHVDAAARIQNLERGFADRWTRKFAQLERVCIAEAG